MKRVLVIFGSKTDEKVYSQIARELKKLKIDFDLRISSAHKTPEDVDNILQNDYAVVVAGAGLAAHLPGVVAARVIRPVIGVPCEGNYQGLDALLSIAQMPPGIPVLAVGVNKGDAAAQNCAKMLKKYESITIIGDKNEESVKKAVETLKKFEVVPVFDDKPSKSSVNIEFTYFDEPVEKKDELVIYCPLLLQKDDEAEAALNFLKHTGHGLWVGINNGINAAVAAVEIMNIDNEYEEMLLMYRREMEKKFWKQTRQKPIRLKRSAKIKAGNKMISDALLKNQLKHTLNKTNFKIGKKYEGKVRDNYVINGKRVIVTTDRISAFDRVLCTLPFKGQVLNQTSSFWFGNTKKIIKNHLLSVPDPNVMVVDECKPYPVEMVVRGYITGVTTTSAWYNYERGVRNFCGNMLPEGLKKNQRLAKPIITPSTKAAHGMHDEPISGEEIIKNGIVDEKTYRKMEKSALELFEFGSKLVAKNNLILVDTKYEFGSLDNNLTLIDEIHTPDSSRFWIKDTYNELFSKGQEPQKLDKEYVRQWLSSKGFMGEGKIPKIPDEVKIEAAKRYITAYEMITGKSFEAENGDVLGRIERNLKEFL